LPADSAADSTADYTADSPADWTAAWTMTTAGDAVGVDLTLRCFGAGTLAPDLRLAVWS